MRNPCLARMGCHLLFVEYQYGTNVNDSVFRDTLRSKYTSSCKNLDSQKGNAGVEMRARSISKQSITTTPFYSIITFGSLRDYDEARNSSQLVAAVHFSVRPGHQLEQLDKELLHQSE